MRRISILAIAGALVSSFTGCARSPVESFKVLGFRGMRVIYVFDSADVEVKDRAPRFANVDVIRGQESPEVGVRSFTGQGLYAWGANCGAKFTPKRGSWDSRMGLSHASDGWNVGDVQVMRNYSRAVNVDYLVVLNRVAVTRGNVVQSGEQVKGTLGYSDVTLDISIIDTRDGKRVWRSLAQGRSEALDSLHRLTPKALEMAVDNFYASLPYVQRWECADLADRFK